MHGAPPAGRSAGLLRPGLLRLVVAAVAMTVVTICVVNSVRRIDTPFPGFFYWQNLFVPAAGSGDWTGPRHGVAYHSWLVEADGAPLTSSADLDRIIAAKAPGDVVHYVLERGGERYQASVPVMRFGWSEHLASVGIYLLDALALMTLAVLISYLKPTGSDAGSLFYFAAVVGLTMATAVDLFGPYWFRPLYFVFFGMAPATALAVVSYFPVGRTRGRWENTGLTAALGLSAAYAIGINWAFTRDHELLLQLDRLGHVYMGVSVLGALGFFLWQFWTTKDHLVRQRTKVVLWATVVAFAPVVAMLLVFAGLTSLPFNLLTLFFVMFPVGIGYAIAKHDLFDIDRVIKRALAYMLLSGMVLGAYALAITTLDGLFENMTGLAQRFTSGIVVLTLMLALNPSRERVQRFVDRIYDRQRWEYRDAVRQASRSFTAILDLPDLLGTALKMIDETVQPVTAEVYTVDEQGNASRRALLRHEPGESGTRAIELLDERAPEVRQVAESLTLRELVTASTPFTIDGEEAPSTLSPYGAMMATGMHFEGRIVGMLMVGPKRSGRWNTSEDGELMRTVADQLAVALQNAEAYETIDNLNRSLETQNVDLERANTELQAAQALLVQAERLAAVGEMSAAVAHAIRNPLAGIKMAAEFGEMEFADHEAAGNFRDILAECDRLNQRITQLLNYSRPFQPDPTRVGLRSVVEGAIGAVRGKAAEKGVRLELQATEDYEVMVDPPLFEQALLELVANAVDASPERERVEVTLGSNGNGTATVEVRDRGAGIPEGKQADLFRLFFTTKKKGTGFGLATVKKIVERHGGQVVAGNAADGGARFVVSVPRAA